jgi:N-acetylglutamate synthase-like GNAT family acetyltransferase
MDTLEQVGQVKIIRRDSLSGILPNLQSLLELCYPKPPKDVFYRVLEQYKTGFPVYAAVREEQEIIGFAYLCPNSKGGTLETLAVHPDFQGLRVGSKIVEEILKNHLGLIQITTRVPIFFEKLGFEPVFTLPDGSHFMICPNFEV